jgi:hypothetical protein
MHPSSNARWLIIVWSLLLTSWSVAQDEPAVSKRKPGQVPEQVSPEGAAYLQRLMKNTPFGSEQFDFEGLRKGMGSRRSIAHPCVYAPQRRSRDTKVRGKRRAIPMGRDHRREGSAVARTNKRRNDGRMSYVRRVMMWDQNDPTRILRRGPKRHLIKLRENQRVPVQERVWIVRVGNRPLRRKSAEKIGVLVQS